MLTTSSPDAPGKPRVFFDSNAGAWCSQLPGRRPVQAESWEAAHDAIRPPATSTELRLAERPAYVPAVVERPARRGWLWRAGFGS